jgi:hypothetical protein
MAPRFETWSTYHRNMRHGGECSQIHICTLSELGHGIDTLRFVRSEPLALRTAYKMEGCEVEDMVNLTNVLTMACSMGASSRITLSG